MKRLVFDDVGMHRLMRRQLGLLTREQALTHGMSCSAIQRRAGGPRRTWTAVLPGVYATFLHPLTRQQMVVAAMLYAGPTAVVTGLAALELYRLPYLPHVTVVDVLVARPLNRRTREFVRVEQTARLPAYRMVDGIRVAPPARAAVDAARRLASNQTVLALATGVVQRGLATVDDLTAEVAAAPRRGTAQIRRALWQVSDGARSVAEGKALELFRAAGLPEPLVNRGVVIPGRLVRCPDFRWGRLIVEIDSREWHLLVPGSWEATLRRRKELERAGYTVLVVTPWELDHEPEQVIADIRARLSPEVA